jgi:hypothetical protein
MSFRNDEVRIRSLVISLQDDVRSTIPEVSDIIDRLSQLYYNLSHDISDEVSDEKLMLSWIDVCIVKMYTFHQMAQSYRNYRKLNSDRFNVFNDCGEDDVITFRSTWKLIANYIQSHPSVLEKFRIPMDEIIGFADHYINLLTRWANHYN